MEQIVSLPWQGPLQLELHEEAAVANNKSIFVARDLAAFAEHLSAGSELPELLIVDSTWASALLDSLADELRGLDLRAVPTLVTECVPTNAPSALSSELNVIAVLNSAHEFTSRLSQIIGVFFDLKQEKSGGPQVTAAEFSPLVQPVLDRPARDKRFFARAQDRKEARRAHMDLHP